MTNCHRLRLFFGYNTPSTSTCANCGQPVAEHHDGSCSQVEFISEHPKREVKSPWWISGRIAVEVDDEEGCCTVTVGGTGLVHTKSPNVALYIAKALRAHERLTARAKTHESVNSRPVRVAMEGPCSCETCVIYREEQES